jgi:hypothetical protein
MKLLRIWFIVVLITMITVVSWASLSESLLKIPPRVGGDPWFVATLFDTYFAFIVIYLWMAYRTPSWPSRILWFILVMGLGNIAIASYLLIQLYRLPPGRGARDLLLRQKRS